MLQLTIDHSHNRCGRKMLRPCFKLHLACAIIAAAELCVRRGNSLGALERLGIFQNGLRSWKGHCRFQAIMRYFPAGMFKI